MKLYTKRFSLIFATALLSSTFIQAGITEQQAQADTTSNNNSEHKIFNRSK
ncbi:hypothetical protein ACFP1H_08900 [Secundilactobacillus hailunensis]|uniref:Uncharacterized protein n=1 Tax=Secundilactobacillus hailunensis TaxID=2559923 RepID=A0ABW1TAJ6_9LACO|nr:hypothetical protein [Secundilactobacillus hailunensis]